MAKPTLAELEARIDELEQHNTEHCAGCVARVREATRRARVEEEHARVKEERARTAAAEAETRAGNRRRAAAVLAAAPARVRISPVVAHVAENGLTTSAWHGPWPVDASCVTGPKWADVDTTEFREALASDPEVVNGVELGAITIEAAP
jgi:septal ring factor EnvC (AmiA/AmiB activator)